MHIPIFVLFMALSLVNHSCNPNAYLLIQDGIACLISSTDILKNSEITIDYLGGELQDNISERHRMLKARFAFDCKCLI